MLHGFIAGRQEGNATKNFPVCEQMCSDQLPIDYERNDIIGHWSFMSWFVDLWTEKLEARFALYIITHS